MNLGGTIRRKSNILDPKKFSGDSDILGASRRVMEERLSMWHRFRNTPHGAVVSALVDPMIMDIDSVLNAPFDADKFKSVEAYSIKMAELRGARLVWEYVKKYPEALKNRLKEIEKEMGINEEIKKD